MFTQEQLVSLKNVIIEVVKPLFGDMDERMNKRFDILEEKMDKGFERADEGFEKMDEKMENIQQLLFKRMDDGFVKMDQKIDIVSKDLGERTEACFGEVQEDIKTVCEAVNKLKSDNFVIKHKLSIAEKNKPALFMGRQ